MEAKGYAQMSSAIPPNTVGYTYTHRRAVALYSTFFSGVIRAPAGYISLGQEINRISRALEHLILEARSPESNLLRNAHGATETLGIALNGVEGSLIEIENVLLELQISRQNQSRWIDFEMQGPCGGEKRLKELEEQIGYHCWAFDLIMRTLMK